jgi:hypothetical protein
MTTTVRIDAELHGDLWLRVAVYLMKFCIVRTYVLAVL